MTRINTIVQNKSQKTSSMLSFWVIVLLAVFFYDSIFSKTEGNSTSVAAISAILVAPFFMPSSLRSGTILKGVSLTVPLMLLAVWYLLLKDFGLIPDSGQAFRTAVYILVMAFCLAFGFVATRNKRSIGTVATVAIACMVIAATMWVQDFNESSASGFAMTKNVVTGTSMHACFLVALLWTHRRPEDARISFYLAAFFCFSIAYIANQRIMVPAAVASVFVFWLSSRGAGKTKKTPLIFLTFGAVSWAIFVFISELNYNPNLVAMNEWAREWTGRRINSGREDLWYIISYNLSNSPLTGLGTGVLPEDLFQTPLASAHNSFLQVTMQVGFIGLALLLLQLYIVLSKASSIKNMPISGISLGYFTFAMAHATFESFLTSNNFIIGALVWLNLGILVGLANPRTAPHQLSKEVARSRHRRTSQISSGRDAESPSVPL